MAGHTPTGGPLAANVAALLERLADCRAYSWPEDDSWTDQQAEDALLLANWAILSARQIAAAE